MENASKALIIAGGILITVLILGSLALLFTNIQVYQNDSDSSKKQSQIGEFNNQYEPYNKSDITLAELKTVYNKIVSNNKQYPEYEIHTNIQEVYENIAENFKELPEEDKINKVFKCTEIEYKNLDGRISLINFEEVTN